MRAIVKYPGSKWALARWIISHFPDHHSYLEPFFGSGAVLFNKPRSHIETVNDIDGQVINLFEWIRIDPERLAHEIYWTPYARQVYENACAEMPEDSLGRAVNFYIGMVSARIWKKWAGRMMYRGGNAPMHRRTGAVSQKRLCRRPNGSEGFRSRTGQRQI